MFQPPVQLPSEVWTHVFRYLSVTDKFSVRASCVYFKKLIDHPSLWTDWTVVLSFPKGSYNSRFWVTLRRRRVSSAVVRSSRTRDWEQLVRELPGLGTLLVDHPSTESLHCLKHFTSLKRLMVRNSSSPIDDFTVLQSERLSHLTLCGCKFSQTTLVNFISTLPRFSGLTSLVCHQVGLFQHSHRILNSLLACLPQLKHLSLSVECVLYSPPRLNLDTIQTVSFLSSLELIDVTDQSLPDNIMQLMPGLKSLVVVHKHSHHNTAGECPPVCHLTTWLRDLPDLSTLAIVKGPPVTEYVHCIPATLMSLTLCVARISSAQMAGVALQVPNLLHLHIDSWPSHLGAHTAQIPQFFPKLQSLKLRHEHVPVQDFLQLHQLKDLKHLEILDSLPRVSELVAELRALTDYRLQITTPPGHRDVMSCSCSVAFLSNCTQIGPARFY